MMEQANNATEREIRVSRLLNAPVLQVWNAWTVADHIKNWWGPEGFTNTITKMDLHPEGEWLLVMHGPDGTDYDNKSIFKELISEQKIVYEHISHPRFVSTITFESKGMQTLLSWQMLFETRESREKVVKVFKADEGLVQNVNKLEAYLQAMAE